MPRLAVIFNNFGPYHLARLDGLWQQANALNWEIMPIELARKDGEYAWQAEIEQRPYSVTSVISNQTLEQTNFGHLARTLYQTLSQSKPDVLAIAGYGTPIMLVALLWSRRHQKPAVLFSESNEHDAARTFWSEAIKRMIVRRYQAALVGGKLHKRYLQKLGLPPASIFFGYNVVGNHTFCPSVIRRLPRPVEKPYFLAINRFITKKNLSFLIDCYASYRAQSSGQAWDLVLCGDGELCPQLQHQVRHLGLQNFVHLPGFLQQEELLPYFAQAKCFIHASIQEQWGLVVNEAMAAGLPVLVSNRCGCFEDLVIEGVNGFGFDPENQQQLTNLMLKMSSDQVNLKEMGQASLDHIQNYSPEHFAQGLLQAAEYALARR